MEREEEVRGGEVQRGEGEWEGQDVHRRTMWLVK